MRTVIDIDSETKEALHAFVRKAEGRFVLLGAILFGSRARKSFRPDSDLDLALLLPSPAGDFVATKLAMADIAYEVLLETGIRIQPLPIWEEQWLYPETFSNPRLLRNIETEGIRF